MTNMFEEINGYFVGTDVLSSLKDAAILKGNLRGTVKNCHQFRSFFPFLATQNLRMKEEVNFNRVVVLLRNPFKTLVSFYSYFATDFNNNKTLKKEEFNPEKWAEFVNIVSKVINEFVHYWVKKAKEGFPVVFIRYEDFIENPSEVLNQFFILNVCSN